MTNSNSKTKKLSLNKILNWDELLSFAEKINKSGGTIALCHGVFDVLHPGHIEHLQQASELADYLLVSITTDKYVNKGPGRPIFTDSVRASSVAALMYVDKVLINNNQTSEALLKLLKPKFYVKGPDYLSTGDTTMGNLRNEIRVVEEYGGEVFFTKGFTASSSTLINEYFSNLRKEARDWLSEFKREYGMSIIEECLEKVGKLKILLVGESILDQYTFCSPLSKSTKDPLLAFQLESTDIFPGGILAIADNCINFVEKVNLITFMGKKDSSTNLAFKKMNQSVTMQIFTTLDRPTITKHRFIDNSSKTKLFEYYNFSDTMISRELQIQINESISAQVLETDMLILADYGHGLFSREVISHIQKTYSYLSVNTQANAGNRGYNTMSKYSEANVITFNGGELELELRNRNPDYYSIIPKLLVEKNASYGILTLGSDGLIVFDKLGNFEKVPAFATSVIDKIGAGDAVFAMASLLAKIEAPLKVIGFLSNLMAAHEVSQSGHSVALTKKDLLKHSRAMLS